MSSMHIIKDTLPRIAFSRIALVGLKALQLATTHELVLASRLPQDLTKALTEDLTALGVVVPQAKQVRNEAQVATSTQYTALRLGYARVSQIRAAVRHSNAPKDVKKAYGVGLRERNYVVRDVVAGMQMILDRANLFPAEAEAFGILKKDTDALATELIAITDADKAQDTKRASAPLATKERNLTGNRVLAAVARIEAAGRLEFAQDEVVRPHFVALGTMSRSRRKEETKEAPTVGAIVAQAKQP